MTSNKEIPLQYKIIQILIDLINEHTLPSSSRRPGIKKNTRFYKQFKGFNRDQLGYKLFSNFRISKEKGPLGLRLTYLGNELCKRHFDFYEFNHDIVPTPKMYLVLDNKMQWPYYFTKRKMVLFNKDDAAWYKLNGKDIEAFIEIL